MNNPIQKSIVEWRKSFDERKRRRRSDKAKAKAKVPKPYVLGDNLRQRLLPHSYGTKKTEYEIRYCAVHNAEKHKADKFPHAALDIEGNFVSLPVLAPPCFGNLREAPDKWCTPRKIKEQSKDEFNQDRKDHTCITCADECTLFNTCRILFETRINIIGDWLKENDNGKIWSPLANIPMVVDGWISNQKFDYSSRVALYDDIALYEKEVEPFNDLLEKREKAYKTHLKTLQKRAELGKRAKLYYKNNRQLLDELQKAFKLFFEIRGKKPKWRQKNKPKSIAILAFARVFLSKVAETKPDYNDLATVVSHMATTSREKHADLIDLLGKDRVEPLTENGRKALISRNKVLSSMMEEDASLSSFSLKWQ